MKHDDAQAQPADEDRLEPSVKRRVRRPLKVPKHTMAPIRDWTEEAGLRRAVAVLKTEAALLRREGFDLQPNALLKVAAALAEAKRRGSTTGEAYALDWVRRDKATAPDDDAQRKANLTAAAAQKDEDAN